MEAKATRRHQDRTKEVQKHASKHQNTTTNQHQALRRRENKRRKRDKEPDGGASVAGMEANGDEGPRHGPENGRPRRRRRPGRMADPAFSRSEGVKER